MRGPGGVGAFVKLVMDTFGQVNGPTFGNLQDRTKSLDEVQAAHGHRHVAARQETA